jgi:hypothetical protein
VNIEIVPRKKKEKLSEYYTKGLSEYYTKGRLQTSQAVDWGLRTPSTSNISLTASSFIARASTCRTQQVWESMNGKA